MIHLITELEKNNVGIGLDGDDLELSFDGPEFDPQLLEQVKANKEQLIAFLKKYAGGGSEAIPVAASQPHYALSDAQRRIWIVSQLREASSAYNMPGYSIMEGTFDAARFNQALLAVIDRHEILRTVFREDESNQIRQWILPASAIDFRLHHHDCSREADPLAHAMAYIREDSFRPFSLERGPLLRASLLQLAEEQFVFYYNMHHIISDGWSMEVLTKDVMALYTAFRANATPDLPALRVQYKDFAAWQLAQATTEKYRRDKAYWLDRLSGELPLLNLPAGKKRPGVKTYRGHSLSTGIAPELTRGLRAFAQHQGGSLFMGLLSVLNVLLHRYTSGQDFIVGAAVAGREHADLEEQIGFYVNTLALRNQVRPESSFKQLFAEVKDATLAAYKHQAYPFDRIVDDLSLQRDASRSPVVDITLTLQNTGDRFGKKHAAAGPEVVDAGPCSAKFDIAFTFEEVGDALSCFVVYNSDVYEQGMVAGLIGHFRQLLSQLPARPEVALGEVPLLTPADQLLLQHFNNTRVDYPGYLTVLDYFRRQVQEHPNRPAVVSEQSQLSFQALDQLSDQLAQYLVLHHQVKPGDYVALQLYRSEWMLVSVLAIWKVGAAYLPIEPDYPPQRLVYIRQDSQYKLCLDAPELERFAALRDDLPQGAPAAEAAPTDTAYVIYTSGSTGQPKGVLNNHAGLLNRLLWMQQDLDVTADDVVLQKTPYTFDVSVWELAMPLLAGCRVVFARPEGHKDPVYLQQLIACHQVTLAHFVPSMLEVFLPEAQAGPCASLRHVVSSGEALSPQLVNAFGRQLPATGLHNYYGPTEAAIDVTAIDLTHVLVAGSVPIGRPVANTHIYIVNDTMQLQPVGVAGELLIGGVQVAQGYLNKPTLTAERFIASPFLAGERLYRTGDFARWLADGTIEYIGRRDHQVKIRGNRIETGEIEAAVLAHPAVRQVVVDVRTVGAEKAIVAYIVPGGRVDKAALRTELGKVLPYYMLPHYYVEVEAIPLSSSGKVSKADLPPVQEEDLIQEELVAPRTAEEKTLLAIWQDVLQRKTISVKDNFYSLGGDSIKSIQIGSRLKQQGYRLTVEHMLNNPVLEDQARHLVPDARTADQQAVVGAVPLTPIQHRFFRDPSLTVPHHYNQSVLLKSAAPLDATLLHRCLAALVEHHDALRMGYQREVDGWRQFNREVAAGSHWVDFHDLRGSADETLRLKELTTALQESIDLTQGPLLRAGHFRLTDGDRLALIVHHLVIDGVSWRILLEDFFSLYTRYRQEANPALPAKTDSYRRWSTLLASYAHEERLLAERKYWEAVGAGQVPTIRTDGGPREPVIRHNQSQSFTLDKAYTSLLQTKVAQVYATEINDVLLTGLGLALREVFGSEAFILKMEGHGREEIIAQADISRTVGWFTSIYPFVLRVPEKERITDVLVGVKEDLRKIPNRGIGYGVLKYLRDDFDSRIAYSAIFNYLGDFDASVGNSQPHGFSFATEEIGPAVAAQNGSDTPLNVSGMIVAGQLTLSVGYAGTLFESHTIDRLVKAYDKHLKALIGTLAAETRQYLTPSDLTFKGLTPEAWVRLNPDHQVDDVYELSPLQQGVYYHWLSDKTSSHYFEQISYRVRSASLDTGHIREAYDRLIARHAVLRSSFRSDHAGTPLQLVHKTVPPSFTCEEATPRTGHPSGEAYVAAARLQERQQGFDLEKPCQMRLKVISLGEGSYEFIWSHHHILMDGWCVGILINEFYRLLESIASGSKLLLPEPARYAGYINWLQKLDKESSLHYWKNYLDQYQSAADLPLARPGTNALPYRKCTEVLEIGGGRLAQLKKVCADINITLNTLVQGAWGYLLSTYNHTQDVVFGAVVSGRPAELPHVESMIGLFINTIPVRVQYGDNETPKTLLQKLQADAIAGSAHHYLGLSDIQADHPQRGSLINHVLVFENYPVKELLRQRAGTTGDPAAAPMTIEAVDTFEQINYDFSLVILPSETALQVRFEYNESRYDPGMMAHVKQHFANTLEGFGNRLEQPLRGMQYLPDEEAQMLLHGFNNTQTPYPADRTVVDLFEAQCAATPHRAALAFGEHTLSYAALDERANQFAAYLRENHQATPHDLIGIKLDRSEWLIAVVLGVLKCGAAYVPIDPAYPQERIAYIERDSRCKVCIDQAILDSFIAGRSGYPNTPPGVAVSGRALAYVMYTSGSTGKPKGVTVPHRAIVRLVRNTNLYQFSPADVLLSAGAFSFDATTFEYWGPLLNGGKLVLCDQETLLNVTALGELIRRQAVGVMFFTTGWLNQLVDTDVTLFGGLRSVLIGGERLSVTHIRKLRDAHPGLEISNCYGPTENTTFSLSHLIGEKEVPADIPVGRPISNSTAYILDKHQRLLPVGVVGEICLGGDGLASGYLHQPELTAAKFIENPFRADSKLYRTGDLGRWLPDGSIAFVGRNDDQVKIRGHRIELGEIAHALAAIPGIRQAEVVVSTETSDKAIVAYIVPEGPADLAVIRQLLGQRLPAYMLPAHYVVLERLPLNGNGKVDKKALPPVQREAMPEKAGVAPRTETEKRLAVLWQEVLGVAQVGITDNFFDLGGHSIKAIKLLHQVTKEFQVALSIRNVFAYPTIEGLGAQISLAKKQEQAMHSATALTEIEL